jgi:MoaA/NifB/PqqE/SkfB family radical SAM enzyme
MATYLTDLDKIALSTDSPPHILSVCFEPTNRCPGKCPYCLIEEHGDDYPTHVLTRTIDRLLDHGTVRVGFGGGEPTIRQDIGQIGARVRQRAGGALLRTSGMFPLDVSQIRDSFDWVDLSMDSSNPKVFRRCRPGVPFDVLTTNISLMVEAGIRIRISILITSRNLATIDRTVRWLNNNGVNIIRLQKLVPRGRARTTWLALKPDNSVEDEVIENTIALGRQLGMDVQQLRTISETTLCIVKGDGQLFTGEPTGVRGRGNVFSDTDIAAVASALFTAQSRAYVANSSYAEAGAVGRRGGTLNNMADGGKL